MRIGIILILFSPVFGGPWSYPSCFTGRQAIVHLFEWKWNDIARECEQILAPAGYCGVQVSPPHENRVIHLPPRPWFERYQPVSYKLITRSGNEQEFRNMVERCNNVNVRIYADIAINQMAIGGASGVGTGGSTYFDLDYPAIPYSSTDFNGRKECPSPDGNVHNYTNKIEVRNCRLAQLSDLKLTESNVQFHVLSFMNKLIDIGVAGFRIDAAKHLWPADLRNIYEKLHHLNTTYFPFDTRPFVFQEDLVIDTEVLPCEVTEYSNLARVTNYAYGTVLSKVLRRKASVRQLMMIEKLPDMPDTDDAIVFIDDSANQRGYGPEKILTNTEPRLYKIASVFMLAYPYGFPRIMSSYDWQRKMVNGSDVNAWMGPPHHDDMSTRSVTSDDNIKCKKDWVCEHRWRAIRNMISFRNNVEGSQMQHWWSNGQYQFAFGRGSKGFVVANAGLVNLDLVLYTGMPVGTYCDVISGDFTAGTCTGNTIKVSYSGYARFQIKADEADPIIAIYVGAKL